MGCRQGHEENGCERAPCAAADQGPDSGGEQGGSGFPSGHAAVAAAMATVAGHHLPALAGHMTRASVAAVALARVYIGAHLPVDVLGGGGLGFSIGTAVLVRHLPTSSTS